MLANCHQNAVVFLYFLQAREAELSGRSTHCEAVCTKGQLLVDSGHFASKEIKTKIKQLHINWIKLWELSETRKERLKEAAQSLQVLKG